MNERLTFANNGEGWSLELKQFWDDERLDPDKPPIVMFPGYCMNTFILNFHPTGTSMVRHLVEGGFEVWTANLRGQGGSKRRTGSKKYGFRQLALVDIPKVVDTVRRKSRTDVDEISAVGCSLGATFLFAYLAHNAADHGVRNLVSVGGPLRWETAHPLLQFAFRSPALAGALPILGTRALAKRLLPAVRRLPFLLTIYMNPAHIDLTQADQLVKTIDDPVPYLNKQIAHWIKSRDLMVDGVNVTERMSDIEVPLLCIAANADGIVPPMVARSAMSAFGSTDVTVLDVGDKERWFAHADLFVNDHAQELVFDPLLDWLRAR